MTRTAARVGPALAATLALAVLHGPPGADATATPRDARAPSDFEAARAAGDWLAGRLEDGAVPTPSGTDLGLTVEVGLALAELDPVRYAPQLAAVDETVAAGAEDHTTGSGDTAGATARLLTYVLVRGDDPRDTGGVDLQQRLESAVSEVPLSRGRLGGSDVAGQAYAARALLTLGSDRAEDVTDYLLAQSCEGLFRADLPAATAPDQGCAGSEPRAGSSDATATAVLQLLAAGATDAPDVDETVADAVDALPRFVVHRDDDGVPNTASAGLALRALEAAGAAVGALGTDLVRTVAAQQVTGLVPCDGRLVPDAVGAVAFDRAEYDAGVDEGITADRAVRWTRTTAVVAPALVGLPTPRDDVRVRSAGSAPFQAAGRPAGVRVVGLALGQKVCLAGPGARVRVTGPGEVAALDLVMPAGTASRTYRLAGVDSAVTFRVLDRARLRVAVARASVPRGGRQTITVRGLEAGERVTVRLAGRVVDRGSAGPRGWFRTRVAAEAPRGRVPVRATGVFPGLRSGTASFRVT